MNYLFTSESVSEGHPDKVADQISDAILDEFLKQDSGAHVACETFCTTDYVLVAGEVTASDGVSVDVEKTVRDTIRRIGYDRPGLGFDASTCRVDVRLHAQSADIHRGVVRESEDAQGAGDQGMMFGYACRDTREYMPLALSLSHKLLQVLAEVRRESPSPMPYLRPDAKSQFTVEFSARHKPLCVKTIVLSSQHDEISAPEFLEAAGKKLAAKNITDEGLVADEAARMRIENDVRSIVLPRLLSSLPEETAALFGEYELLVNPTGKFVIGGPAGDTGLTGRKIIVDTYGGRGAHGGGAFSGKDPSKVDRSAAYASRWIAKNLVAAGVCDECLVQLAYAIGVADPVSVFVDTYGSAKVRPLSDSAAGISDEKGEATDAYIASVVQSIFNLKPAAIVRRLGLKNPIYSPTAAYGHMGREPQEKTVSCRCNEGAWADRKVQLFAWEKLDMVDEVRKAFGL